MLFSSSSVEVEVICSFLMSPLSASILRVSPLGIGIHVLVDGSKQTMSKTQIRVAIGLWSERTHRLRRRGFTRYGCVDGTCNSGFRPGWSISICSGGGLPSLHTDEGEAADTRPCVAPTEDTAHADPLT